MAVSELRELVRDPVIAGMCQVVINRVACGQPSVGTWEGGCVHEHITTEIGICAGHRELAARPFTCVACEPDHECTAQLREVTR